jgi:hypothetical protein
VSAYFTRINKPSREYAKNVECQAYNMEGKPVSIKCLLMNQLAKPATILKKAPVLKYLLPKTATEYGGY